MLLSGSPGSSDSSNCFFYETDPASYDPDAYVGVEDFHRAIADSPDWRIVSHEKRPRPPGSASSHHVDDIVLRAYRATT